MLYFAYGSNMNIAHMRRMCGWNCRPLGAALLRGFEFGFDLRGYNNVRPNNSEQTWGVLFEINEAALATMDQFEGYPNVFNRQEVEVTDNSGKSMTAWMYFQPEDQFGGKHAKPEHLKGILIGARENGLPEEWIGKLETFF